mmetsp:Transcript_44001/g.104126  ORF Transcript_44001/g.104126 Transcript_44001/m.104126 type:complete len:508 (+) Transcript_44001:94-1617(+)
MAGSPSGLNDLKLRGNASSLTQASSPMGVTPASSARRSRSRLALSLARSDTAAAVLDSTAGAGGRARGGSKALPSQSTSHPSEGDSVVIGRRSAHREVTLALHATEDHPYEADGDQQRPMVIGEEESPGTCSENELSAAQHSICSSGSQEEDWSGNSSRPIAHVFIEEHAADNDLVPQVKLRLEESQLQQSEAEEPMEEEEPEEASSIMVAERSVARSTCSSMMAHVAVYCYNSRPEIDAEKKQTTDAEQVNLQHRVEEYQSQLREMQAEVDYLRQRAQEQEQSRAQAPTLATSTLEDAKAHLQEAVVQPSSPPPQRPSLKWVPSEVQQRCVKCDVWRFQPMQHSALPVRLWPKINAQPTGDKLQPGDYFLVSESTVGQDGVVFLRLAGGLGWVPNRSPAAKGALCVPYSGKGLGIYGQHPAPASAFIRRRQGGRSNVSSMPQLTRKLPAIATRGKAKAQHSLTASASVTLPALQSSVATAAAGQTRSLSPKAVSSRCSKGSARPWY